MAKITIEKFELACRGDKNSQDPHRKLGSRGIITTIAKRLGVARISVYRYLDRSKKARQIYEEESEKPFDDSEDLLYSRLIVDRDIKAAETFLLKHKRGRLRGYGDHQELVHKGKVLMVKWEDDDETTGNNNEEVPKAEDSMGSPERQDTH